MVAAMLLAHLIGDYVLQWDKLARLKFQEFKGVLAHGAIVGLVTWLCSLPFDTNWWPYVLIIGLTHVAIDAFPLWLGKRVRLQGAGIAGLVRYAIDQAVHLSIILIVLVWSGYLAVPSLVTDLVNALRHNRLLAILIGYAFITTPAWVLVEFTAYGLINQSAPDFSCSTNKYIGILERGLITTFVATGQFTLVPVVTLPRLLLEERPATGSQQAVLYVAELLASVTLAVAVGLVLRHL